MQRLEIGKRLVSLHKEYTRYELSDLTTKQFGFSLLELLVVLVIIGIIISVALLALGNLGKTREIRNAAEEFSNLLPVVEEQAILKPNIYGLEVNTKGYGFYQIITLNNKTQWMAINDDPLLRFRTWPAGTQIHLKISGQSPLPIPGPSIIINSSGNITPFTLEIGEYRPSYLIEVFESGAVLQKDL